MMITGSETQMREILNDPTTSDWLKLALLTSMHRDPVDAARDAELLASLLSARTDRILAEYKGSSGPD